VLPEGVLNNTNLQKIRDFVESRAKIILITSIPQDVFIASGATVKPSLLFFKKFTEEEAKFWKKVAIKAENDIQKKYEPQTKLIVEKLEMRGNEAPSPAEKKALRAELKQLEDKIAAEIKAQIKTEFNYEIPIAEVEKAGISSTGSVIENELEPLAKEFIEYRKAKQLWESKFENVSYEILEDDKLYRMIAGEPEVFYGK